MADANQARVIVPMSVTSLHINKSLDNIQKTFYALVYIYAVNLSTWKFRNKMM